MKKGAAHVGFCQAQDKEGHNLNRMIVFIELFPEGAPTGEFAANSLQGAKYIDVKCRFPAKLKLAKSGDHGLRNCCFRKQCRIRKVPLSRPFPGSSFVLPRE